MKSKNSRYLEIHLAVLLFGGAGLFGKVIQLSSGGIVLGRAFMAGLFLFVVKTILKESFATNSRKDLLTFVGLGFVLAFHWVAFFKAIQLSTVAIGLLTFSTFPIFTTFLEPLVNKERLKLVDLVLAAVAFIGVALVMPSMDFKDQYTQGALWGIASGASFAVLALMSKRMVATYSSNMVSFYQNSLAALFLLPFFWKDILAASLLDGIYLVILGIVFTGIAHTLFIKSMQGIKAQTASLITSLEPVYGIFLAWLFLDEWPTFKMLLGGLLILGVAFYATVRGEELE